MSKKKIKFIKPEQLSTIKMTTGGERKITAVIDTEYVVKRWVGIGWVTEGSADASDFKKLPVVIRKPLHELV